MSDISYSRLKLLACAIEAAFKSHDFNEAKTLLSEREILLNELGPNARLNPAQAQDISNIEARIGWQIHNTRAEFATAFRRLSRAKNVVRTYGGTGKPRFERAS